MLARRVERRRIDFDDRHVLAVGPEMLRHDARAEAEHDDVLGVGREAVRQRFEHVGVGRDRTVVGIGPVLHEPVLDEVFFVEIRIGVTRHLGNLDVAEYRAVFGFYAERVFERRKRTEQIHVARLAGEQSGRQYRNGDGRNQDGPPVAARQVLGEAGERERDDTRADGQQQDGAKVAQVGNEYKGGEQHAGHRADGADKENATGAGVARRGGAALQRDQQRVHRRQRDQRQREQQGRADEAADHETRARQLGKCQRIGDRRDQDCDGRHHRRGEQAKLDRRRPAGRRHDAAEAIADGEKDQRDRQDSRPDIQADAEVGRHDA